MTTEELKTLSEDVKETLNLVLFKMRKFDDGQKIDDYDGAVLKEYLTSVKVAVDALLVPILDENDYEDSYYESGCTADY